MVIEMQSIVLTLYLYLTFTYKFAKENFKKVLEKLFEGKRKKGVDRDIATAVEANYCSKS